MLAQFYSEHWSDKSGMPTGGVTSGRGLCISWQNGPLGRDDDRIEPNGVFVETVIKAAKDRIEYYQSSRFVCGDNQDAIEYLDKALESLNRRTQGREDRKIEGTHAV